MPPVRITIEVDDKGSAKIASTTTALKSLEQQTIKVGQVSTQATTGTTGLTNSLAGMARSVTGIVAVTTGIAGLGGALAAAGQSIVKFDSAMGTVNTLIAGNIPLQQQLRAEILKLPPALGDSAEMAKGLYAALSAGIEPAKAVQFVADAAIAAKAGLSDMNTTTDLLAKTLRFFGTEVKTVSEVSDIMFQTVNLGFGTFEQFAGAFSQVNPLAAQLGVTLKENAAALATLSSAFKSPAEAGTGLTSLYANLIQHTKDFSAVGIDLAKVIGEEGVAGVMRRLWDVTGGSATAIQKFIPDINGLQAAMALGGKTAGEFQRSIQGMGEATGKALGAFQERTKTMAEQWNTFVSSLGKLVAEQSGPVTQALGDMLTSATNLVEYLRKNSPLDIKINVLVGETSPKEIFSELIYWLQTTDKVLMQLESDLARYAKGDWDTLAAAVMNAVRSYKEFFSMEPHVNTFSMSVDDLAKQHAALKARVEETRGSFDQSEKDVEAVKNAYDALGQAMSDAEKASAQSTSTMATGAQAVVSAAKNVGTSLVDMRDMASKLGLALKDDLITSANEAFSALQTLTSKGVVGIRELAEEWPKLREKAIRAWGELPQDWQKMENELLGYARQTGVGIYEALKKGIDASNKAFDEMASSAEASFKRYVDSVKQQVKDLENTTVDAYNNMRRAGETDVEGHRTRSGRTDAEGHVYREDREESSSSDSDGSSDSYTVSSGEQRESSRESLRRRNRRVTGTRRGNVVTSESGQRYYTNSQGQVVSQEVNTSGGQRTQQGESRSYDTSSAESIRKEIRKFEEAIRNLNKITVSDYTGYTKGGEYERWQINEYRKAIGALNKELQSYYEDHPEERRVQVGGGLYTGAEYDALEAEKAERRKRNQERAKKISEANTRTSSGVDTMSTSERDRWDRRYSSLEAEGYYKKSASERWQSDRESAIGSTSGKESYATWSKQQKNAGKSYSYDEYLKSTGKTEEYTVTDAASGATYNFYFSLSGSLDGEAAWENLYKRIRDAQRQGKLVA